MIAIFINEIATEDELHKVLRSSEEYSKTTFYPDDTLVHETGVLKTHGVVNDGEFIHSAGNIAILKKDVEMYMWVSYWHGGSSGRSYKKEWRSKYKEVSTLLPTEAYKNKRPEREIGQFYFYPESLEISSVKLPTVNLRADKYISLVFATAPEGTFIEGPYIYLNSNTSISPEIGDIRIKYSGLMSEGKVTVFGKTQNNHFLMNGIGNDLESFYGKDIEAVVFTGDLNDVINSCLDNESKLKSMMRWILGAMLLYPILKLSIFIFNIYNKKRINTYLKTLIFILLIMPVSIVIDYALIKLVLFMKVYF